jgi:superfamily I DNA/RNA helicase
LIRCNDVPGLSEEGRKGLSKLGLQLKGLEHVSPLGLLTTWLFERSAYLNPLLTANDAKSQQRLVAIYHLLKVCGEFASEGNSSRKRFLERIRRIELLNEDTPYRAVSSEASDMDAVRVMTIHGSKGLEFRAVHFPAIATGYMPSSWRGDRIPAPPSLPHLSMREDGHHAEEECLFFVGLSRAKDHLSLSERVQVFSLHRFCGSDCSISRNRQDIWHCPGAPTSWVAGGVLRTRFGCLHAVSGPLWLHRYRRFTWQPD